MTAPKLSIRLQLLILACGVLVVFGQTLSFEFVDWDDPVYITTNYVVLSGLGWGQIQWAFATKYFGLWQPLSWLSHMLDASLWGSAPAGHHATSVLFHTAAAGFLLALMRESGVSAPRTFLIAIVFALHPLRAESVAWVSERKDVMCLLWLMICFWSYARWVRLRGTGYLMTAHVACLLAVMSKPLAVVAPALLLLLDYWPLSRNVSIPKLIVEKIGFWIISAFALSIAFAYKVGATDTGILGDGQLEIHGFSRVWIVTNAVWIYAFKHFWPVDLAFFHEIDFSTLPMQGLWGLGFLTGLLFLAYSQRKTRPWITFGILWYLVALAPSSGIVRISDFSHADRYSYLPSVGLLVAVLLTIRFPPSAALRQSAVVAMGLVLALMIGVSIWQVSHWRNSESLFSRALEINPDNNFAQVKLAEYFLARGELDEAERRIGLATAPGQGQNFQAYKYDLLGLISFNRQDFARAKSFWHQGLAIRPDSQTLLCNLGTLALEERDNLTALQYFRKCLRTGVGISAFWNNYGNALERTGSLAEAELAYRKAIRVDPLNLAPVINLAKRLESQGKRNEAHALYLKGLQIAPTQPLAVAGANRTR
ncbi:MAG: tetratricopeptide repeat protein [Betaproteobacteria bacterium]|nr:tetratricopeptide repeat protein [Betaproteobacteria bacterium]